MGRRKILVFLIALAAAAIVSCSGGDDNQTADSDIAADGTVVVTNVKVTAPHESVTANTVAAITVLPELVGTDTAALTRAALEGTPLAAWVSLAAPADAAAPADPCALAANPAMDTTLFHDAALIADPVLAELLLNLDAEQSAMRSYCTAGSTDEATTVAGDIQRTVALIDERLVAVGVR